MSTTRKTTKIPVFHTITTKRNCVKRIHSLMRRGLELSTAIKKEAKTLNVNYTQNNQNTSISHCNY